MRMAARTKSRVILLVLLPQNFALISYPSLVKLSRVVWTASIVYNYKYLHKAKKYKNKGNISLYLKSTLYETIIGVIIMKNMRNCQFYINSFNFLSISWIFSGLFLKSSVVSITKTL